MNRLPLFYRILAFSLVLIVISVSISSWIVYNLDKAQLEKSLANELLSIVNTSAPFIDGDLHQLITLTPEGKISHEEEFESLRSRLLMIKNANHLPSKRDSPIYTLRKAPDFATSGELEFVVMSDRNSEGKFFTGFRYKAEPHNLLGLEGKPAASRIYQDKYGIWISACSPIRDSGGRIVGILQADRPVDFFYAEASRQALLLFFSALISVVIAAVLAILFARSLVSPVRQLVEIHRQFGSGIMSARIAVSRSDEIGLLMQSFNQMADGLSKANRLLEDYNQTLEQKVEDRTRELQTSNLALVALNNEKNEMLGIAAHDLKNPLSGVLGYADMVREFPDLPREEVEDFMQKIIHQAKRMLLLITNLLDVNAIERGNLKINLIPLDLVLSVQSVALSYQLKAREKELRLVEDFCQQPALIVADADVIIQVLDNLISNAIKYSPPDRSIYLRVRPHSNLFRFEVQDEGPGLSEEDMKKLFGKFARLTARPTAGESSTGLGLSIVKKMAEAMHARVWCESTLGKGATFIVEFPEAPSRTLSATSHAVDEPPQAVEPR